MRRACGVNRWAGESSRKPRSPRPSPIIRASHTRRPTVFIATRRFGSAPQFLNRGAARHVATNAPDTRPSNRDAARHVATKTTCTNMTMWESTTGKGEIRLDARVWWTGGRGNLRENREDPAPTVGICGDGMACRTAIQMPIHGLCSDVARRVAILERNAALSITTRHAALVREGTWGGAGNSRPAHTAPPLPRAQ